MPVLVALAIAVPCAVALWIAHREALSRETERLRDYSREMLSRATQAAWEVTHVGDTLAGMAGPPCSESHLAQMRRLATQLTYVKVVGFVADDRLVCSSLGAGGAAQNLGSAEWGGHQGIAMRTRVRFDFDPEHAYLVAEHRHHATLIDGDLALPVLAVRSGMFSALYAWHNGRVLVERGRDEPVPERWLLRFDNPERLPDSGYSTFRDGDFLVNVTYSTTYQVAALAALPLSHVQALARRQALWLLPLALLVSALLLLLIRNISRHGRSLEAAIRRAIRRRESHLVYQPIVELDGEQWIGAEALLRWTDSEGVTHRPDVFIPAAERAGVMSELTAHVMELLMEQLDGVFARHPRLVISLNVSSQDVAEPERLLASLARLQQATKAGPRNLKIELTEHSLVEQEPAGRLLRQARAMGVSVAIDDFGIGYSSLAHLERFELDALKIDKLFVDTMRGDAPTSQVALHIIQLARALNIRAIAEGVETREQAQFLRVLGVQHAQGWFFSQAIEFDEFLSIYASQGSMPSTAETRDPQARAASGIRAVPAVA
jgi:sensor c-di-GMP phosphodiesterase-like protein